MLSIQRNFGLMLVFAAIGVGCEWTKVHIGEQEAGIYVYTDDMDGDGDRDLLVTSNTQKPGYASEVSWWENQAGGFGWRKHVVDSAAQGSSITMANGVVSADFSGNGSRSVVVATGPIRPLVGGVYMYTQHADGQDGWSRQQLYWSDANNFWKVYALDANQDGLLDVVVGGGQQAFVLLNHRQAEQQWQPLGLGEGTGVCIYLGDVNGDGRTDVVSSNFFSGTLAWTDLPIIDGELSPRTYLVDGNVPRSFDVNLLDIDGNGTMEIVASVFRLNGVYWYDANGDPMGPWTKSAVDPDYSATDLYTGDINQDGRTDIGAVSFGAIDGSVPSSIVWFENTPDRSFVKRVIDDGENKTPGDFELQDIDADGNLDLITTSHLSNEVMWYRNNQTEFKMLKSTGVQPSALPLQERDWPEEVRQWVGRFR